MFTETPPRYAALGAKSNDMKCSAGLVAAEPKASGLKGSPAAQPQPWEGLSGPTLAGPIAAIAAVLPQLSAAPAPRPLSAG
ncbi:hypothetical protein JTP77_039225, partial [Streptomyces sp. S9]|nr:hypothetical protein [Streptomyces sp. S9]